MLLDDREQVAEQPPLRRRQLGTIYGAVLFRVLNAVDRRPRSDQGGSSNGGRMPVAVPPDAGPVALTIAVPGTAGTGRVATQTLRRGFALVRYLRPSSYRAVYAL
jgi:hypothetical protein